MAARGAVDGVTAKFGGLDLAGNVPIWDEVNVKLAFVNADDGIHEEFTRRLCNELLSDPELAVVAVLENGTGANQREISRAIEVNNLRHWICGENECRRVGNNERDGITIIYNSNKIQREPEVGFCKDVRYIYLIGNFINPHGDPLSVNITAVHLRKDPVVRRGLYPQLKRHWETAKNSELAVIMGDFNDPIAEVRRHGINGHHAFETGYLTTNAPIKPGNIDNSYSNRLHAERDRRVWEGFYHKIGIVTYSIQKMRPR